jgi:hypothetical protein
MIIWYDCPGCGAPESSDGEHMCGACERRYRQSEEAFAVQEIARIKLQILACPCQESGPEEPCGACYWRYACICSLQGDERGAEALINH